MRVLGIIGLYLVLYGLLFGDYSDFVYQFWSNSLVHIMSIDFILVTIFFPVILKDDMKRRNIFDRRNFWIYSLTPVIGPLYYLNIRTTQNYK